MPEARSRRPEPIVARRVVIFDVGGPIDMEFAHEMGATHTINSSREDPVQAIMRITENYGADYAFDAIGRPAVTRQAWDSVRRGGTRTRSRTKVPAVLQRIAEC